MDAQRLYHVFTASFDSGTRTSPSLSSPRLPLLTPLPRPISDPNVRIAAELELKKVHKPWPCTPE